PRRTPATTRSDHDDATAMESLVTMKSRMAAEAVSVETVAAMETLASVPASMAPLAHCVAWRYWNYKECHCQEGNCRCSSHCLTPLRSRPPDKPCVNR